MLVIIMAGTVHDVYLKIPRDSGRVITSNGMIYTMCDDYVALCCFPL